jgi:hypothetical protein
MDRAATNRAAMHRAATDRAEQAQERVQGWLHRGTQ